MNSATSLEELTTFFEMKLDKLEKVIQLVHINMDSEAKKTLIKMDADLTVTRNILHDLKGLAVKYQRDLGELKILQSEAVEVNRQLSHQILNLPSHLPTCHTCESNDTTASPLRERQLSGTKPSKNNGNNIPSIPYITVREFDSVPKYIRGRLTYDKINCCIAELNKAYFSKYKILKCPKSTMNDKTRYKYNCYKEQESNQTKGEYFCVEEDIKESTSLKLDHHGRQMITILRHLQRVKEIRGGNLVRYAIVQ